MAGDISLSCATVAAYDLSLQPAHLLCFFAFDDLIAFLHYFCGRAHVRLCRAVLTAKRIGMLLRKLSFAILAFAGCCLSVSAQTGIMRGSLAGRVMDALGAAIPGAKISITSTSNATTGATTSGDDGAFSLENLQSGTYAVEVDAPGFARFHYEDVIIAMGRTTRLDPRLQVAQETQQVTVSASATIIDTSQSSSATNIDRDRIEELPIPGRNYLNFTLLSPAVTGANPVLAVSSAAEGGFSTGGLRPSSNSLTIDGAENNDEYTGLSRTELSPEAISDFQVVNHGYAAQFGGAAGGTVNVETRSGSTIQHGDAFIFLQNGVLNATPPLGLAPHRPDESRLRAGLSTGGEWRWAGITYYVAGEQEMSKGEEAADFSAQRATAINSVLSKSGPLKEFEIRQGFFPTTNQATELSGRVNRNFGKHIVMLRYAFMNNRAVNDAFNLQDIADLSARGSAFYSDNGVNGLWSYAFSPRWLNQITFELAQRRVEQRTEETATPGVIVAGEAEFGTPFAGNSRRYETHAGFGESLLLQRGKHLFQTGFSTTHIGLRSATRDGMAGLYVFSDSAIFTSGKPDFFVQVFGDSNSDLGELRASGWAQDKWSPTSNLTLDLGLRYDVNRLPGRMPQNWRNLSPRIGFAWSGRGRWVLRGGFGTFYDRFLLSSLGRIEQFDGIRAQEQIVEGTNAALLWQSGTRLTMPLRGIAPSIWQSAHPLKNPYAETASLGFEHALGAQWTASVEYRFVRGVHLGRAVNVNLPAPVILTSANAASLGVDSPTPQQLGRPVFGPQRLNPALDAINQFQTEASSDYNGATFSINRQFTEDFQLMAGYTLAKSVDDASSDEEQAQNPYERGSERARSLNEQRHRLVLSGLWLLGEDPDDQPKAGGAKKGNRLMSALEGLEFAPIFMVGSGTPQNPMTGADSNREHIYPFASRPLGAGRNSMTTPHRVNFDFRVLKVVPIGRGRFDIVAESFNVLNHQTVELINPAFGSNVVAGSQFMQPIQAGDARRIQFSLDYEY
jgi:hypothetical protein